MSNTNDQHPKRITLSKIQPILSRTDLSGNIRYCNPYFSEVCGYTEKELLGSPHSIIRHPDMPKVIFKLMWKRIQNNEDMLAIVKNKTKNGDYYWVTTLFETKYHPYTKKPEGYLALRRAAPDDAIRDIEPLYKKLVEIEASEGMDASEAYFLNFLREQDKDYDTYVKELTQYRGLVAAFFNSVRKLLHHGDSA